MSRVSSKRQTNSSGLKSCKVVICGDTTVGKTAMIHNYVNNKFDDKYEPNVLDVFKGEKPIDGEVYDVEINDTGGDENITDQRKLVYKDADLFMLCVSAVSRDSLNNIGKWKTEIRGIEQDSPIVLVITKIDLRQEMPDKAISIKEIKAATKKHRLIKYFETTAKNVDDFNVHKCFNKAIKLVAFEDDD